MTPLIRIAAIAAAYAILGKLGLALAIPPGYATPVFPAAGLAVACALRYGNRILPAIWLGSLVINVAVSPAHWKTFLVSLLLSALLGLGAMLQTWCARILVTRLRGDSWRTLETERDIVLFLLVAAPLSCLVSATSGIASLYATGVLPFSDLLYSWWNWWVGDTLGVCVFAPLTLIFLLRAESPWKERQIAIAVPMILTLGVSAALFLGVSYGERTQLKDRIKDHGRELAELLERRMVAHQEALSSLRRLIEVMPDMTYRQFEYFTRITLHDNRDLFALSYNSLVQQRDRRSFEQAMAKRNGMPVFSITERDSARQLIPAAVRPHYVAVGYIAPLEGNRPAVGFDINSEPIRRAAIARAVSSGRPAVTAPIRLVQEDRQRTGVLVLHPAFRRGADFSSSPENTVTGFAVGVIKLDEMVEIATRAAVQQDIVFRLSDPQADPDRRMLFQSAGGWSQLATPFAWRSQLTMADRQWDLEVFPTRNFLRTHRSWQAWGIGVAGVVFCVLMQVIMLAMTGRTSAIRRQVDEKTRQLTSAKGQLELLNHSLQQRIDESVAELRHKDQVLISQGRQAAMGEMIGNIAHQWRQPLNALAMLVINIQLSYQHQELTEEYLDSAVAKAGRLIQKMSTTINDFRNFFRPDKERVPFSARQQILQAVDLVEEAFRHSAIEITIEAGQDALLYGFPNEYSQVLLNLLTNAKEAILEAKVSTGRIFITLREEQGMGVLTVQDNGAGIPEEIIDKIFEPYFSTKSMGTGIGLYMSKTIVERNMGGAITVRNTPTGSLFTISVPLAESPVEP